jgi:hypothetical protein
MRILANDLEWLASAADLLDAGHDVVRLDGDAIRRAWQTPDGDWWRRLVPDGWVPDVAVLALPEYRPLPPLLSALPCPVVLWVGDWYANAQAVSWVAGQAELILADATGVAAMRRSAIRSDVAELCPWTYDPRVHRPDWDAQPLRDVGFMGNMGEALQAPRNRWLARIARLAPDLRVELGAGRFGDDYVRFVQTSKLTFNYSLTGDVNMRCFEATACGSATLINRAALEQVSRWFEPGRELIPYDATDFEDVVDHYLRDDDARKAIARAGWARVQEHGPAQRLQQLVGLLERVAGLPRRADLPTPGRAGGASARQALSVADTAAAPGYEIAIDGAATEAPGDAGDQLALAATYLHIAGSDHPRAGDALLWVGEALDAAARLDPACATSALARAQLMLLLEHRDIARTLADQLVVELLAHRAVARADRQPLVDAVAWRRQRQDAILAGGDPTDELTRLTLVEALKLSASADADPARRSNTLATALAASAGDVSVRLKLAIALLACDPPAALPHTRIVVADLPLNVTGWTAHAHALVASGGLDEAEAFVQARLALAQRVTVDPAQLQQLSAVVAPVAA